MKNKQLIAAILSASAIAIFAPGAVADGQLQDDSTDWYAGGTIGQLRLDGSGSSFDDIEHFLAGINFGYRANDYLSFEGRVGKGSEKRTSLYNQGVYTSVDLELDHYYGAYALLTIPLPGTVTPYLIAGKTWTEYSASVRGFSFSEKSDDMSYGIGFNISASDQADLRLEYLDWGDDAESFGFSLLGRF